MARGYLAIVLHAHLPFVRHPDDPTVMEERWLHEAITETYLPLLRVLEGLRSGANGVASAIGPVRVDRHALPRRVRRVDNGLHLLVRHRFASGDVSAASGGSVDLDDIRPCVYLCSHGGGDVIDPR